MIIDTHCHLESEQFREDIDDVISRADEKGIKKLISLGSDIASSVANIEISKKYSNVYPACGIHPECCMGTDVNDLKRIKELILDNPCVKAVGEIGLDLHYAEASLEKQIEILIPQMDFAEEIGLPWVIHCRDAEEHLVEIIKSRNYLTRSATGVIHCFNASQKAADLYMDCGFYVSLGGYITYPSSRNLLPVIKTLRLDRIMVETDAPYLPPQSKRGKRNESSYIDETVSFLADLLEMSPEEIEDITTENAIRCFKL